MGNFEEQMMIKAINSFASMAGDDKKKKQEWCHQISNITNDETQIFFWRQITNYWRILGNKCNHYINKLITHTEYMVDRVGSLL